MAEKFPRNWAESPAGRATKPGFGGKDTRIFSGDTPDMSGGISPYKKPMKGQHGLLHDH